MDPAHTMGTHPGVLSGIIRASHPTSTQGTQDWPPTLFQGYTQRGRLKPPRKTRGGQEEGGALAAPRVTSQTFGKGQNMTEKRQMSLSRARDTGLCAQAPTPATSSRQRRGSRCQAPPRHQAPPTCRAPPRQQAPPTVQTPPRLQSAGPTLQGAGFTPAPLHPSGPAFCPTLPPPP